MRLFWVFIAAFLAMQTGDAFYRPVNAVYAEEAMRLEIDEKPLRFDLGNTKADFAVEIADTDQKRMQGLMFRQDFPADRAMLFDFGETRTVMMWMRNTPLPLDMVFLDAQGKIVSLHEGAVPFSETIISSKLPAAYVIEVNAGTIKRLGLKPGLHVRHQVICGDCTAH